MAVVNSFRFGSRSNNSSNQQDRPKAEFWLNVGYVSDMKDEDTGENRFVSLAQGIPLDTTEDLNTNSSNQMYAAFQSARNDLRDQLIEVAKELIRVRRPTWHRTPTLVCASRSVESGKKPLLRPAVPTPSPRSWHWAADPTEAPWETRVPLFRSHDGKTEKLKT